MKRCKHYRIAQRYLDGELSADESRRYESHLADCAECKKYFGDIAALKTVFGRNQPVIPPHGFEEKILRQVVINAPRRKEMFWRNMGAISKKFIPAAAGFSILMIFLTLSTFLAWNTGETVSSGGYYLDYKFEKHEMTFLQGDDDSATTALYTVLTNSNEFGVTY